MDKNTREYRVSRGLYMAQAALEYLVALMVDSTFLARLTQSLGISDRVTGLISSFISLGCLFQLLSLGVRRKRVKGFVTALSIANQLLFTFLYVIPVTPLPQSVKGAVFVVSLFLAYFLYYFAHPKKVSWHMSLVEDGRRGRFTADKEIVSLAVGIGFTYTMGELSDRFREAGQMNTAFVIMALVLLALTVLHTLTLVCSIEPEIDPGERRTGALGNMLSLLRDRTVRRIAVVFILWHAALGLSLRFYGTFMNGELGFSLLLASVLSSAGSVVRIFVSHPLGRYADRHSFAALIRICLLVAALAFGAVAFATVSTGKIVFALYFMLFGIADGGINGSLTNLVFDYVPPERTADALAVCQSSGGVIGFLTTLAAGPVLELIQKNGNVVFGVHVYAQQIFSFFAALLCVAAALFVSFKFLKEKWQDGAQ